VRLFIGIGLPEGCCRRIIAAISPLRAKGPPVSWVAERNLHLTLKFLGETSPGEIDGLAGFMAVAARDIPLFEFRVEGGGGFPSLAAPRILWIGISEPLELVGKLHQNMENTLSAAGFPREGRPFHPHVTVGRIKGRVAPGWGGTFASAVSGTTFGTVFAASYRIYESRLSPSGANYTVLREIPFGGGLERSPERGAGG
jgi:2'-5' RNA ligase